MKNSEQKDEFVTSSGNIANAMLPAVAISKMPLLFSTPMVEAIINDWKNVTRRLKGLENINNNPDDWKVIGLNKDEGYATFVNDKTMWVERVKNPYNKEFIWVREKWRRNETQTGYPYHFYAEDDVYTDRDNERWKPSIHMPFEACRLFLKVKNVTVERLHDITEESAIKEGVSIPAKSFGKEFRAYVNYQQEGHYYDNAVNSFESLWQVINGNWNLNPFVWVIEFERCIQP